MGADDAGAGVFWMFYTGADWEAVSVPDVLSGSFDQAEVEGLRMRPGLALSQASYLPRSRSTDGDMVVTVLRKRG
jgi:hypothetical protein